MNHPICFSPPLRIASSGWHLHVPFAMFLVDLLKPEVLIELGTHYGVSYCAFCQAVSELRLPTRCYAIDTWEGDPQAGLYGPEVYKDLCEHHDPLYSGFSRLIQSTFDKAVNHFEDGSIDLLHIDGYHTYESVKHDWETWQPKLSNQGVVLFHDINVRERDFEVWKLWGELKQEFPNFEIIHGHGLGLLVVGDDKPKEIDMLINASAEQINLIQSFFWQIGSGVKKSQESKQLQDQLSTQEKVIQTQSEAVDEKEKIVQGLKVELAEKEQIVQGLKGKLAENEQIVQDLEVKLAENEQNFQNLKIELAEKEQIVQDLKVELAEKNEVEKDLQSQLVDNEDRLEALTVRDAKKERTIQGMKTQLAENISEKNILQEQIQETKNQLNNNEKTLGQLNSKLLEIYGSSAWRIIKFLWRIRVFIAPPGSKREDIGKAIMSFNKKDKEMKKEQFKKEKDKLNDISPDVPHVKQNQINVNVFDIQDDRQRAERYWDEYIFEKRRFEQLRKDTISNLSLEKPELIEVSKESLSEESRSINLPKFNNPEVSIIIPVKNNIRLTIECLLSIVNNTSNIHYEIIIVDDASNDETEEILLEIERLLYIKNDNNLGFLHSCNKGKKQAKGEYLLILNNDVQVQQGWLSNLVEPIKENIAIGAVGPKVLYPNGRLQEAGARINIDGSTELIGLADDPALPRYNYLREVDYCSGVCLLIRAEDFLDADIFDIDFAPAYCEDVDLCLRLQQRGKKIIYSPKSEIIHHLSATTNKINISHKLKLVTNNTQKLVERWGDNIQELNKIRLISFYLPQYHPIPENDLWWGQGFTEWKNVGKALPNFLGHQQPKVPTDLGYYDLRLLEVMENQAELAKRYGIFGFCYYYYWFNGKRLLDYPIERVLTTDKPNIPFCLCWANENWTRTWDGQHNHQLISQNHSDEDDLNFIINISRFFQHANYIRINNKPLLLIYRIDLFPDIKNTVEIWRNYCRDNEIGEIYLVMVQSFDQAKKRTHPDLLGFDAAVEFPPHEYGKKTNAPGRIINPEFSGNIYDYRETFRNYIGKQLQPYTYFRGVMPSWDNTPRRQNNPTIFINSSPSYYQVWLENMINLTRQQNHGDEQIVFINAWNEWGEGNYLEPDLDHGHAYLEATKNALESQYLKSGE